MLVRARRFVFARSLTAIVLAGLAVAACSSGSNPALEPVATTSQAETPDSFGVGTGRDSAFAAVLANTVVNTYAGITAVDATGTQVTVASTAGFAAGDLVMLWRSNGLTGATSGVQTAVSLTGDVGAYEFGRVKTTTATTLTLTNPLSSTTRFATFSQVVRVPEYTTVSIPALTSVVASAWNGTTGGIVVFFATGTVTVGGSIVADADGFRGGGIENINVSNGRNSTALDGPTLEGGGPTSGGAHKGEGFEADAWAAANTAAPASDPTKSYGRGSYANGAGGGEAWNAGGGGGGNGGQGGIGGETWLGDGSRAVGGLGGAAVTFAAADHLGMGGGGGAGEENNNGGTSGGNGGGVVLLRIDTLAGGTISANGASVTAVGTNDGQGGAGAGGTIVLDVRNAANCTGLSANGGKGGSGGSDPDGPGGGGGGGVIVVNAASGTCTATVTGGANGVTTAGAPYTGTAYGAAAGSVGVATSSGIGYGGMACTSSVLATNTCGGCVFNTDCPASLSHCLAATNTCAACTTNTDCSATTPICSANACVACNGDNGSGATNACPSGLAPYCAATGACGACSSDTDCTTGTHAGPFCNLLTGACGNQCSTDIECGLGEWCNNITAGGVCQPKVVNGQPVPGGSCTPTIAGRACVSAVCDPTDKDCGIANGDPSCTALSGPVVCRSMICQTTGPLAGDCVQCVVGATCATASPVCDATTDTCVVCNGDNGTGASDPCPSSGQPYCVLGSGTCGTCTSDSQCGTGHAGAFCNTLTGACGDTCSTDAECGPGNWCDNVTSAGMCQPLVSNGNPVPGGVCTPALAGRACVSGICTLTGAQAGDCVQCTDSSQCPALTPECNTATNTCVAEGTDAGTDAGGGTDAGEGADASTGKDAGSDAGAEKDGGSDAGGQKDAGSVAEAGTGQDAGNAGDGGSGSDSGVGADSGTGEDSGAPDAAMSAEAGSSDGSAGGDSGGGAGDGGPITESDSGEEADGSLSGGVGGGGCSCRTEGARETGAYPVFAVLAVGLLATRRRRTRQGDRKDRA